MHCIEPDEGAARRAPRAQARAAALVALVSAAVLAGCAQPPAAPPPAPRAPATAPAPVRPAQPAASPAPAPGPAAQAPAELPSAGATVKAPRVVKLGPPATPRTVAELQQQFARRLVAAHPDGTYMSRAPDRLLAIPVIAVELNADGSVRNIDVLRRPSTGDEATVLAIDAIRRAAPYGDVSRLPRPWKVIETFLFDDDLRFKPRTLDLQ